MTIYFIAPYGEYRVEMTEDMPEWEPMLARIGGWLAEHPTAHLPNWTGRLNGIYGSYVVMG